MSTEMLHKMHPEDVKAELRKRFGKVRQFEREKGLPINGVADLLRGKPSKRVREAVESALMEPLDTPKSKTTHLKILQGGVSND